MSFAQSIAAHYGSGNKNDTAIEMRKTGNNNGENIRIPKDQKQ